MNMNELNSTYMHLEWFAWVVHPQSPQVKNTESVEATLNGVRKMDHDGIPSIHLSAARRFVDI
jgi:hypothetical protein